MSTVNVGGVDLSELCISDKEIYLPTELGVMSMSLKRLLALFQDGKIKVYDHNRGFGKASKNTIEATRNNLQVSTLGMLRISNEGVIADGNSRMLGINLRFMDGNITESELDAQVTILFFFTRGIYEAIPKCGSANWTYERQQTYKSRIRDGAIGSVRCHFYWNKSKFIANIAFS